MNMIKKILGSCFLIALAGAPIFASAQSSSDVIQLNVEGVAEKQSGPRGQNASLRDAQLKATVQIIEQLIGQNKTERYMSTIRGKVMAQSGRFIQFLRQGDATQRGEDTVMPVTVKISVGNLKSILAGEGMLYQNDGPASILPLIHISERGAQARSFKWWVQEASSQTSFLRELLKAGLKILDGQLRSKNFYLIDSVTAHHVQWMPEVYRTESIAPEDIQTLGEFFKASTVIQGDVVLDTSQAGVARANLKLVALQTSNGRIVGEITRGFDASGPDSDTAVQSVVKKAFEEASKDLVAQIFETWTKGTFGASLVKISLRGRPTYQELEAFKKQALTKILDLKSLKERRFENGLVVFEAETGVSPQVLSQKLVQARFDGFAVVTERVESEMVDLRWTKDGAK